MFFANFLWWKIEHSFIRFPFQQQWPAAITNTGILYSMVLRPVLVSRCWKNGCGQLTVKILGFCLERMESGDCAKTRRKRMNKETKCVGKTSFLVNLRLMYLESGYLKTSFPSLYLSQTHTHTQRERDRERETYTHVYT